MATIEELLVLVDATTEGLRKEMKRGADETEKFRKNTKKRLSSVEKSFNALGTSVKRAMAGFSAALSITALTRYTRGAIEFGDRIGKAARTAGVAAEQLQELRFAFSQLAGTNDKEVDESIRRFNRRIGLAIQGQGEAIKVSAALGIAFRDQGGAIRETGELLDETLKKLAAVEDDSIRAAQASQLFGEDAGPRLSAALGEGIEAMEALRAAVPGVLSQDQVDRAEALTDAFDTMARTVGGTLKAALIDTTAALGRFFNAASAFATVDEITGQIDELQEKLRNLPVSVGEGDPLFGLREKYETDLNFLFDRLQGIVGERTSELNETLLQEIESPGSSIVSGASNVGANLLAEMGDVRAAGLEEIDPSTAVAFQAQLQQMEDHVDSVRESVLSLDLTTKEKAAKMAESWEGLGNAVSTTLRTSFSNVLLGVEQNWRDTIRRMVADWISQQALIGIGTAIGGPIGGFLSGVTGRASGGPTTAGRPYVVGEQGPELFVPSVNGRVLNSNQVAGASFAISTTIDARGADPALLTRLGPALDQRDMRLKAEIGTMIRRGRI